jgi:predicted neuraminidase
MGDRTGMIYKGQMPNLLCCDSTLRKMPNGDWITVFLSGGYAEPMPENNVFITRSTDEGKTWSVISPIFDGGTGTYVPTEIVVTDSKAFLYVCKHDGGFWDWSCHYTVSEDSGYTWSELIPIPHRTRNTAIRNGIVLRNGTWVLPYQHYIEDEAEAIAVRESGKAFHRTRMTSTENGIMVSRDQGNTWDCHDGVILSRGYFNWSENNVIELSNGTLVMLIRVDKSGVLYRSDSADEGKNWSPAVPTSIPNPGTKFRLFAYTHRDLRHIALVHNPSSGVGVTGAGRTPLSLWISDDDLVTWSVQRDLVTFPGELAYPDGFLDEEQGYIHFAFDYNRHDVIYYGAQIYEGDVK